MAEFEKRLACLIEADGGLGKDPAEMQVHIFDPSSKPAARSFHIACFRD